MSVEEKLYYKYWGKASKDNENYHLLPYHCLDVAAVGKVLLDKHLFLKNTLSKLAGISEEELVIWVVFFLAIHDLGKFSSGFQNLRPDILEKLQCRTSSKNYTLRHDSIGFMLWNSIIRAWLLNLETVKKGRTRGRTIQYGVDYWAAAVTGHHGLPPKSEGSLNSYLEENDKLAVIKYCEDIEKLFVGSKASLPQLEIENSIKFSWWLAGFAVLCDWLGSSNSFKYQSQEIKLEDYWKTALKKANDVILESELLPSKVAPLKKLQSLFSGVIQTPTPLQKACEELPIENNPQMFILEDVTGAGKTEAALILVHRLLSQSGSTGAYFALPTMATANAMYDRMAKVYHNLYEDESKPSLILAHGAREMSASFRQSVVKVNLRSENDYGDNTEAAASHCGAWLADNRKKALLAEIGVGTIDQSLLAMLPSKHQSLRLLGLLGKVLVVDEVHACDAYVLELLCAVIRAHTFSGGSTILLSATLPQKQRQALLNAFYKGIDKSAYKIQKSAFNDYPLVTYSNKLSSSEQVVATRESVKRKVQVKMIHSNHEVVELIEKAVKEGKCVCWIRNTVDHARHAFTQLSALMPKENVDLFHARFTMVDRLSIEDRVIGNFGKNSTPEIRTGKVLIATQVVEQSLDLDFDLMVTDLAPIDLIIQRAGRLCRHTRDRLGNVIDGKDQRGTPTLIVNGPNPNGELSKKWFDAYFEKAGGVYPNHGQLWLGAKLLADRRSFLMPEDARMLIESVYGDVEIPEPLQEASLDAIGEASAERGLARLNQLELEAGYGAGYENRWWDEATTPTRLGEESITVYLALWDGKKLSPWAAGSDNPWPRSALQLRKKLLGEVAIDEKILEKEIKQTMEQLPAKGKWGVLLPVQKVDDEVFEAVIPRAKKEKSFRYSQNDGFVVLV